MILTTVSGSGTNSSGTESRVTCRAGRTGAGVIYRVLILSQAADGTS